VAPGLGADRRWRPGSGCWLSDNDPHQCGTQAGIERNTTQRAGHGAIMTG